MTADRRAQYLRPSGAAVWTLCASYLRACAEYEAPPDTADDIRVREEGTACHWAAQERFAGKDVPAGAVSPNGVAIDQDMLNASHLHVTTMLDTEWQNWAAEQLLDCSLIYPGMPGSPDFWGYRPGLLRIGDLKYGYGFVEVYKNLQLTIYALVLANLLGLPDTDEVELVIVQPRAITNEGPVRRWRTTVGWLRTNMLGFLQMKAVQAMNDMLATAGLHCLDCPGRFHCSTFINQCHEVVRVSSQSVPLDLSPAALGAELRVVKDMRKLLEGREESLKAQVESHLRAGKSVPGWQFKPSKGREAFLPGMEKAFMGAAKIYGVDASRPITPSEARKVLPAIAVDPFVNRPKAGLALTFVGADQVEKQLRK